MKNALDFARILSVYSYFAAEEHFENLPRMMKKIDRTITNPRLTGHNRGNRKVYVLGTHKYAFCIQFTWDYRHSCEYLNHAARSLFGNERSWHFYSKNATCSTV